MEVLLRERRARADGFVEYNDSEVSAPSINIGSAPDQTLQLIGRDIAPQHAQIRMSGARTRIACRRGLHVLVNGTKVRGASLQQGDRIEISGHQLQLVESPTGFDLALEITPNAAVQSSDFASAFRIELEQTWLSKRIAAWSLFGVILLLTLVLPLSELVLKPGKVNRPWSPADAQWSTGDLLPAHQLAIGDNCNACHAKPFARVRDDDCLTCHDHTRDHIEAALAGRAGLDHVRCATCHQEHNEPAHLDRDVELAVHGLSCPTQALCLDQGSPDHGRFCARHSSEIRGLSASSRTASGRYRPDVRLAFRAQRNKGCEGIVESEVSARRASRCQQGTKGHR